jgi:hypothetical protein
MAGLVGYNFHMAFNGSWCSFGVFFQESTPGAIRWIIGVFRRRYDSGKFLVPFEPGLGYV